MNASHLSRLGSLVALVLASRRGAVSSEMVQRFLSGIAVMVGLAVTLGLCIGSLFIAALYGTYRGLVANGLNPEIALLCVVVIMALIVVLLCLALREKLRSLRELPSMIIRAETPIASDVRQTVNAFVDGLMGRNSRPL